MSNCTSDIPSCSKRMFNESPNDCISSNTFITIDTGEKRLKLESVVDLPKTAPTKKKNQSEAIRKWQLSTIRKCIYENGVNAVLESLPNQGRESDRSTLNILTNNSNFENEAVLMAIERKGLRQPLDECNSIYSYQSIPTNKSNECEYSKSSEEHQNIVKNSDENNTDSAFHNADELNFEENFLTTAVSAAIEEKGLSMCPM